MPSADYQTACKFVTYDHKMVWKSYGSNEKITIFWFMKQEPKEERSLASPGAAYRLEISP